MKKDSDIEKAKGAAWMEAVHVNWTKPQYISKGEYATEDFEILTTILSALKWREKNGSIKMITDSRGAEYYKSRGMCSIWNDIETILDEVPDCIDPCMFWAGGKLFALSKSTAPLAVLDTDFIVWDKIAFNNLGDIAVIHDEDIYPDVYPDREHFKMKNGYKFDPALDWSVRPVNAAFYVISNNELLKCYTSEALRFMENAGQGDNLTYMVFAEQRLLSMCAKKLGIDIYVISNLERLFKDGERYFTHTWGMKQQMRDMPELRTDFCLRCINRIMREFPEYAEMLSGIDELSKYFE